MAIWKIENGLDLLITALCLDYTRRKRAIDSGAVSQRIATEFKYYNFKIFDAAAAVVGEKFAELYIDEIGKRTGYAQSKIDCASEVAYKEYKKRIKENIARKLHLCD